MRIDQCYTLREKGQNYAQAIIYEWEDIISRELNIPVKKLSLSRFGKVCKFCNNHFGVKLPILTTNSFRFVVNGKDYDYLMNDSHVVPCFIDFFEHKEQLDAFFAKHSKNKVVFLSSPFDYQYLKTQGCSIPIGLFAYSLPDEYSLMENNIMEKKYDIVLTGRQDPLLYSFFKEYVMKHPNVSYVKRGQSLENDFYKTENYFLNGKENIGGIKTRKEFMTLQSQGRVTLYGVQGYYEGYTKGFYHVTPHFLEIIASASHVIAHYPSGRDGIDAQYYELNKFSPSIEKYSDFEAAMDKALTTDVNLQKYSSYLKKHYTSVRVSQLREQLESL